MAEGMQAAGAYVEVLPSLRNFFGRVKKSVTGQAVDVDVSPKVNQGDLIKAKQQVEKAADGVAKARQKEADAAGAVRAAEARLETLRESGKARADQLVAAEERVEKAKRSSTAATEALNRAEGAQRTASRKVERIEADLKVNTSGGEAEVRGFAARAKAALGALRGKVDVDTGGAEQEVRGLGGRVRSAMSQFGGEAGGAAGGGIASGLAGKGAAIGAAGVAIGGLLVAGVTQAMDVSAARAKLTAQLGASGEEAKAYGAIAGRLYSAAYGENLEQVNDAIRTVVQNIGAMDDPSLERVSGKVLNLASVFGVDLQGATAAVGTMLRSGLAPDADAALDVITTGFQMGADKAGDFLDTLTEYSVQFQKLGIDGATATALINQGLVAGARSSDLVADALKEFSIRAIDGSTKTADGFRMIGLNAQDMAAKIAKGGPEAASALDMTLDRLRAMPDPVQRSQAAVALFGTQAEDLGEALYALDPSEATNEMVAFGGAADRMGQTLQQTAGARIESFKRTLQTGLVDFIGGAVLPIFDVLGSVGAGLFGDAWGPVKDFLGFLAGTGGTIATVIGIIAAATWVWTAASAALNATFLANPIFWVIAAIVALVAILIYAWNNWDWFRNAVVGAWNGIVAAATWAWQNILSPIFSVIGTVLTAVGGFFVWLWQSVVVPAWNGIVAVISWAWNTIIWPVLQAIGTALAVLGAVIFTVLVAPFLIAWNLISAVVSWAVNSVLIPLWNGVVVPALQFLGSVFTWLWQNVVVPVWNGIVAAVQFAWAVLQGIWYRLLVPALQFVGSIFMWLWQNIVVPAWNGMLVAIQFVWGIMQAIWYGAIVPGLQFLGSIFTWLYVNVVKPMWDAMGAAINFVWTNVIKPAFDAVWGGLQWLGARFDDAVRNIMRIWDGIRGVLARPINFMINTVWNNGILKAWNMVAGLVGLAPVQPLAPIAEFARGGMHEDHRAQITGTGGPIRVWSEPETGGEAYIPMSPKKRGRSTAILDTVADRFGYQLAPRNMAMFADGGLWRLLARAAPPGSRVSSAYRPGDSGYHGAGKAVDLVGNLPAINQQIARAYPNSAQLIYTPGVNLFRGRPHTYNAATRADHYDHVHWAMDSAAQLAGNPSAEGGGLFSFISTFFRDRARDAFDTVTNPVIAGIKALMGSPPPAWREAVPALATKIRDTARDFVFKKADEKDQASSFTDPGGAGVERWRPMVMQALGRVGQPGGFADITLRRMNQESGGNPRAINNWDSNARKGIPSKGLMQVIDPTFRAYRDPGLSSDIWDPLANTVASMRYALRRYGSLPAAYNRAGGYDSGGLATSAGLLLKQTVSPERVLSPRQTQAFERLVGVLDRGEVLPDGRVVPLGPAATANPSATIGPAVSTARIDSLAATGTRAGVTVNVYPNPGQDPEEIAEHAIRKLDFAVRT